MKYYIFLILFLTQTIITSAQEKKVEEVSVLTSKGILYGSLHLPEGKNKKMTVVIIQPGSGPTDRNGNSGTQLVSNCYKMLADSLNANNIAALLVDKRSVGKSIGTIVKEDSLLFTTYVSDLKDWIHFMQKDKRIGKIIIAGHSEGSLVGMLAAQNEKVQGFISIAGAGQNIKNIIVSQVTRQSKTLGHQFDSLMMRIKNNEEIGKVAPELTSILRPSVRPYLKSWMLFEPTTEIKKLNIPILILQGKNDLQVDVAEAEYLHAAAPKSVMVLIPGMNHILKITSDKPLENYASYSKPGLPLSSELSQTIISWIKKNK